MSHPEKILCIQTSSLCRYAGHPLPRGYIPSDIDLCRHVFANAQWLVRDAIEHDPAYKQIVPYVVFRHAPSHSRLRGPSDLVFIYARGKGEDRLSSQLSIGVGGHIEERDRRAGASPWEAYRAGLCREVAEEVEFDGRYVDDDDLPVMAGFINDDTNPVGACHLGVLHIAALRTPRIHAVDREALAGAGLISVSALELVADRLEGWSRIVLASRWGHHA